MRNLFAVLLAGGLIYAQAPDQGERGRAMSDLHATRRLFLDAVGSLTPAQWKFKPGPDRWSIAEIAEHIALSEDMLFQVVTEKILKSPADASKKSEVKDEEVLQIVADRSTKATAPERLQPTGRWPTKQAVMDHFKASRDRTIEYIQTTQDPLRRHFMQNRTAGMLDAYQWILVISAHSQRHIDQIKEVMAHPGFPK